MPTILITNIVEYILVGLVITMVLYPYVSYYISEKTLKGSMYDNGVGYVEAFYQSCKHRFADAFGTLAFLFLLASYFSLFALTLFVFFVYVMIVGRYAISKGHIPGSIEWMD